MKLQVLDGEFSVCKVNDAAQIDLSDEFCFVFKTDKEMSVLCRSDLAPQAVLAREDGFRGLRFEGTLDFALVGVLAKITGILAQNAISVFAVSTYDTDYLFIKDACLLGALEALKKAEYQIL